MVKKRSLWFTDVARFGKGWEHRNECGRETDPTKRVIGSEPIELSL